MNSIIIFLGLLAILYIGRVIITPLLLAAFIWYLTNSISAYYRKVLPWQKSIASGAVSLILSIATIFWLIYAFVTQIQPMFAELIAKMPEIQIKLHSMLDYLLSSFGMKLDPSSMPDLGSVFASIGTSAAGIATTIGMVLVYIFFMFVEQSTFAKKMIAMFPEKRKLKKMRFILNSISDNMKKYMFMKTMVSLLTAALSYAWLKYLGLEFAGVWAFVIFIMNYIPTFGAVISCAAPIMFSLIASNSAQMPILVAIGLIGIQIVLGNILEPKLTGKTLNLSTLAILINLVFWGMLWGPVGMFFSVPMLVATFIICAQFDKTRWIAVLLSANGEIPEKEDDE